MDLIVYISNKEIQIAEGIKNKKNPKMNMCRSFTVPSGSLINGMVMDSDAFISFLKEIWKINKLPTQNITLVINSTKFVGKKIELPLLNEKKTMNYIEREFTDLGDREDRIIRYVTLNNSGKIANVYAESVQTDYVDEIVRVFNEAGLDVKTICSGESGIICEVMNTFAKKTKTFVVLVVDGMSLITVLWVNGSFYYYNSSRCFSEHETEQYAEEVAKIVGQIKQFIKAEQIEEIIEKIYIAGVSNSFIPILVEKVRNYGMVAEIELIYENSSYSDQKKKMLQKYQLVGSGLFIMDKHENFYRSKSQKAGNEKKIERYQGAIIPIGLIILAAIMVYFVTFGFRVYKNAELKKLRNQNATYVSTESRYSELNNSIHDMENTYYGIKNIDENIYTYPVCNKIIRDEIEECAKGYAEINIEAFDAASGRVTISASAPDVKLTNQFIKNLLQKEIFSNVDYTGYSYDSENQMWDIYVMCTLSESAGKQVD